MLSGSSMVCVVQKNEPRSGKFAADRGSLTRKSLAWVLYQLGPNTPNSYREYPYGVPLAVPSMRT
jgi:hypothetical protein